jgi:hypothetical protein
MVELRLKAQGASGPAVGVDSQRHRIQSLPEPLVEFILKAQGTSAVVDSQRHRIQSLPEPLVEFILKAQGTSAVDFDSQS